MTNCRNIINNFKYYEAIFQFGNLNKIHPFIHCPQAIKPKKNKFLPFFLFPTEGRIKVIMFPYSEKNT